MQSLVTHAHILKGCSPVFNFKNCIRDILLSFGKGIIMHFGLQAVSNNRVEFNLFNGVHDLFIPFLSPSSDLTHSVTCTPLFLFSLPSVSIISPFFHSIISLPPESCQYDIHSSKGEPGPFSAPCALRPSPGSQPQSICNYSCTISAHRHCSCSDEAHLL